MHPPARDILAKTVFPVLSSPSRSRPATSRYERVTVEWRLPGAGRVRLMHTVAVVLAGGTGERFSTSVPKQLLPFAGRPLIEHSVAAFDGAPAVDAVLVVMAASHAAQAREALAAGGYRKLDGVITGGPSRNWATASATCSFTTRRGRWWTSGSSPTAQLRSPRTGPWPWPCPPPTRSPWSPTGP